MTLALRLRRRSAALAPAFAVFLGACGDTAGDVVVAREHEAGVPARSRSEAGAPPADGGHAGIPAAPAPACAGDCGGTPSASGTCATGSDCPASAAICDAIGGVCVGCRDNHDCSDNKAPFCHPTRHACAECLSDTDCGGSGTCTPPGKCAQPCATADDCKSHSGTGVCDVAAGLCVECLSDSDCKDGKKPPCTGGICASD